MEQTGYHRIELSPPLVLCCASFSVWQMGVVYFSGTALSVQGSTPLLEISLWLPAIIAAGYILSLLYLIFFPGYTLWGARAAACLGFLSGLPLFFSLPAPLDAVCYGIQVFCCIWLIGMNISLSVHLYTPKTELFCCLAATVPGGLTIALLQNNLFAIPPWVYLLLSTIAPLCLCVLYFRLPTLWPNTAPKAALPAPRHYAAGVLLLIGLSCILTLFGSAVAESGSMGVSVFYLSAAAAGGVVYLLWRCRGIRPLRCAGSLVALSALGFLLAAASMQLPWLFLPACGLLGGGLTVCCLSSYFGLLLYDRQPSRWIAPGILALALAAVLLHTLLLQALRGSLTILYILYSFIAVCACLLYLLAEPVLLWQSRPGEETAAPAVLPADSPPIETGFPGITAQEKRIADLILRGYTGTEIAAALHITENTVKSYRKSLYGKLDIHSRRELYTLFCRENEKIHRETL